MANSQYEYVKAYEQDVPLLPGCWVVIRLDGRGFTRFSDEHGFEKPNDARALDLMNACAVALAKEFPDIRIAFGESDEYSFVLSKDSKLWGRRGYKLVSVFASAFAGQYVFLWPEFFPDSKLLYPPQFDGRAVLYPSDRTLRDYLSWRQVDTHINNLYNTCFWCLVKSGKTKQEAQKVLEGTLSDFKNELLFSTFGINYAELPAMFRRGSVVLRVTRAVDAVSSRGEPIVRQKSAVEVVHEDIIRDAFWHAHPHLLAAG